MMCATLLKPEKTECPRQAVYRASEGIFNGMRRRYEMTLRWALRHPRFMLPLIAGHVW